MVSLPKHSMIKPHGTLIITPLDGSKEQQIDLCQCVHCQKTWLMQPGSGRLRGYCGRCNGYVCGSHACFECKGPWERYCDLAEAGKLHTL